MQKVMPEFNSAFSKLQSWTDVTAHRGWQKRWYKWMDRGETQLFLGVLLMLSLFLNESWVLGNQANSTDDVLYGILSFVFIIFLLESAILSFVQPHYFLGFFFWMDVLGTISIIFDIGWFADSLFGGKGNSTSILRATRAAKLGARYGRLMRILKLMKFIKFLPCIASDDAAEKPEPSLTAVRKVSNTLTNVLSQRVAGLVMLLVIVLPFLAYDTPPYDSSPLAWVRNIKLIAKNANANGALMTSVVEKFEHFYRFKDQKLQSVFVTSPDPTKCVSSTFFPTTDIRSSNLLTVKSDFEVAGTVYVVSAVMDITIPHKMDSLYGILIIILVIFVLVFFSASFQNAVDSLMVVPLEKIMTALRTSATIMLKSMKAANQEDEAGKTAEDDDDEDGELETQMLEKMVEKLVKIVGHMSGGSQLLADQDKNVDSATANWLSSTYAQSNVITKQNTSSTLQEEGSHQKRLSSLSDASLAVTIDVLNSWDFDVLQLNGDQLSDIFIYLFNIMNIVDEFKVPLPVLKTFLTDIAGKYQPNTYHNYQHGYDVAHTVYRLMMVPRLNLVFSHMELFSLLVAAVAHDVGHPGVNNLYLVNSKNELALRHNDRSPLENMHCSVLYEVLSKDKTNIFINLTEGQWRESRKVILACILGTDMSQHFDQISKLQVFSEVNGEDTGKFCAGIKDNIDVLAEEKSRLFILEICLHCADISNPYKPFKICAKWADLIVEEFARQGDREKSEGLAVSPMMDRATIMICTMQMGFIEFVVAPLIIAFINVFPPHFQIGLNMSDNYCAWADQRKEEIRKDDKIANKEEEIKKLEERQAKFKGRLNFCNDLVNKPRRGSATISKDEFPALESKIKSSSAAR